MGKGFFITGTDTGVGKTFIIAGIGAVLKEKGVNVGVMKPVETGCSEGEGGFKPQDAIILKRMAGVDDELDLINPYRFKVSVAPSIASSDAGQTIDLGRIKGCYEDLASRHDLMLVEGVGGLLVPLNERETVADLVRLLGLPLIVIVASRLGAINHTLLTVRYAQEHGIESKGIILNHPNLSLDEAIRTNKDEIKRLVNLPILGEMPFCDEDRSPQMVKRYLNLSLFLA